MKLNLMKASQTISLKQTVINFHHLGEIGINMGGGKVVFVKEGLIVNKIKEFETNKSEKNMFGTNHFQ